MYNKIKCNKLANWYYIYIYIYILTDMCELHCRPYFPYGRKWITSKTVIFCRRHNWLWYSFFSVIPRRLNFMLTFRNTVPSSQVA